MKTLPLKLDKVISPDAGPYFVATDTAGITRVSRVLRGWDGLLQDYRDTPGVTVWSIENFGENQHETVCAIMGSSGLSGLRNVTHA